MNCLSWTGDYGKKTKILLFSISSYLYPYFSTNPQISNSSHHELHCIFFLVYSNVALKSDERKNNDHVNRISDSL